MRNIFYFLFLIFSPVSYADASREETLDRNGDGKPDEVIQYRGDKKKFRKRDIGYDGLFDAFYHYNDRGHLEYTVYDRNGDGREDEWRTPDRGRSYLREQDKNFDGKVDRRAYMAPQYDASLKMVRDIYVWKEEDKDFDGLIDGYRVRGQNKPKNDLTGQPIDPVALPDKSPKKAESGGAGGRASGAWDLRSELEKKEVLENK